MPTLTVKISPALERELATEAKKRRVTKSEIARERLASPDKAGLSLWDRIKDLVIDDPNSPTDLSSNKKYMKDYGKNRADRRRPARRRAA